MQTFGNTKTLHVPKRCRLGFGTEIQALVASLWEGQSGEPDLALLPLTRVATVSGRFESRACRLHRREFHHQQNVAGERRPFRGHAVY